MLVFQFLSNKRLFHFKRDIYWISFLFLRYRWFERIGFFSIRRNERKQKKFMHKRGNPRQLYFYIFLQVGGFSNETLHMEVSKLLFFPCNFESSFFPTDISNIQSLFGSPPNQVNVVHIPSQEEKANSQGNQELSIC